MFNRVGKTLFLASALAAACGVQADNAEDSNKSNNPLNVAPGANLQDYYTPKLYDSNAHSNDVLLRGTLPIAPNDFIGVPQLVRAAFENLRDVAVKRLADDADSEAKIVEVLARAAGELKRVQ